MGNGSPRLLTRFVRRTAVAVLTALAFAPSAFADDALVGASATVGPVTVTASVGGTSEPVPVQAPADVAPVSRPVATSVAEQHKQTVRAASQQAVRAASQNAEAITAGVTEAPIVRAALDTPVAPQTQRATSPTPSPKARIPRRNATNVAKQSQRRRSLLLTIVSSPERGRATAPMQAAALPRSLPAQTLAAGALVTKTTPGGAETPQFPPPGPPTFGLGATGAAGSGSGFGFLLFALAAGLALLGLPSLGRRVLPYLAAARPYPYLLQLERPD